MISIQQIDDLLESGGAVIDSDGSKVGKVEQVFVGDTSHEPQWITAKTGLFGNSETFIPLEQAHIEGSNVQVPYAKEMIKDAPRTDSADGHLEPEEEAELYRYYGINRRDSADSGDSRNSGDSRDSGDDSFRDADRTSAGAADEGRPSESSEELGTDAGGVRLRKYTVRENITMSVPVEHEEIRVVQDPGAGDDAPGQNTGDRHSDGPGRDREVRGRDAEGTDMEHNDAEGKVMNGSEADSTRPAGAHRSAGSQTSGDAGGAKAKSAESKSEKSEGFGHNEYDQMTGPQSEDLQHPKGTEEEQSGSGRDRNRQPHGDEDPHNTESHGRHAR